MKRCNALLLILVYIISGCDFNSMVEQNAQLEKIIKKKVNRDAVHLAQLKAVYGLTYINYVDGIIFDDMYIRHDVAELNYGFKLDSSSIKIISQDTKQILSVRLKTPKLISIDRRAINIEQSDPDFRPTNDTMDKVDVEQELNKELKKARNRLEEKTLERTRESSKRYFMALAKRYNLELDIAFSD